MSSDPEPDETTTTTGEATGRRRNGAAASSTGSSGASDGAGAFFSDPGPRFDAEQAAGEPAPEPAEPEVIDALWSEPVVRSLLEAQGATLHSLLGKADSDWVYTRDELRSIAPPLTRILNRYPVTQAAAGTGDELALILALSGYTLRSIKERRAALEQAKPDPVDEPLGAPIFPGEQPPAGTTIIDDEPPPLAPR